MLQVLTSLLGPHAFTGNRLCRIACDLLRAMPDAEGVCSRRTKPSASSVTAMFQAGAVLSGSVPLAFGASRLYVPTLAMRHVVACPLCSRLGTVDPGCYFSRLVATVTHGWAPELPPGPLVRVIPYNIGLFGGNYVKTVRYSAAFARLFQKMVVSGQLLPARDSAILPYNAMNVVLKKSDVYCAKLQAAVSVTDDASLLLANEMLSSLGSPPIKPRLVSDFTGSGWNGGMVVPSFSQTSIHGATDLMQPGCVMSVMDFDNWFPTFLLAPSVAHHTAVRGPDGKPMVSLWYRRRSMVLR